MQADTFAAEDSQMVRAVEMLHSLWVFLAQLLCQGLLVLVGASTAGLLEIEVRLGQYRVLLDYLVEDVDIERKALCTLKLLHEFAADRASHSVVMVEVLDAGGTEGMPTVDQDARDALSHIVAEPAELADVQASGRVVKVQNRLSLLLAGRVHILIFLIINFQYIKLLKFIFNVGNLS